jgi:hypothetical protein
MPWRTISTSVTTAAPDRSASTPAATASSSATMVSA